MTVDDIDLTILTDIASGESHWPLAPKTTAMQTNSSRRN